MANKFPLILNTSANQIQEIASGDNLDLTGCGINNAGVITATSFSGNGAGLIGVASTDYILTGTAATFTGGVDINSDLDVDGHTNLDNVSVAGVITATSFVGSGANLTGIDATSIKDPAGNVKVQAQASGAMHTGISTFGDIDVDGHTNLDNVNITGVSTFSGALDINAGLDVSGLSDLAASTFNNVRAGWSGDGEIDTSSGNLILDSAGGTVEVTDNLSVTGSLTGTTATFSGNVSIGGTLTYEDVTNIDSVGLITARNGINVSSGTATFAGAIDANGNLDVDGATSLDALTVDDDATFNGATTNMVWDKSDSKLKFNNILNIYNKDGGSRIDAASGGMFFKATGAYVWSNNSLGTRFEALDSSCILYANGGKVARSRPGELQIGNPDASIGVGATLGITGNAFFGGTGIVTATSFKLPDGSNVGGVDSDSDENTVAGTGAGANFTGGSGLKNTCFGKDAGNDITSGDFNVAIGHQTLDACNTGRFNTAVGNDALGGLTSGVESTAFGYNAGLGGNGGKNVFMGYAAGQAVTSGDNTIVGYEAGKANNTNGKLVAFGMEAAHNSTSSQRLTALGYQAGRGHTGGNGNTYVGYQAGKLNGMGDMNCVMGDQTVRNSSDFNRATVFGAYAAGGFGSNANDNTVIGYNAGSSSLTGTNNVIIGSGANLSGNVSNEITLGNASITKFRIPGIGLELTGPVGLTTEQVTPSSNVATLNLAKDDHKIVASGTYTVNVSGGTEAGSHTLRIENSGTANVGFSTYFKFPSGGTPSLPTASGAISLISFTVHKVGSVGIATVLLAGASVNYS